jgi:hypothetical protein
MLAFPHDISLALQGFKVFEKKKIENAFPPKMVESKD